MILAVALLAAGGPALVVSPAAGRLSVTVYRDPDRARRQPMNLGYLNGFALVTETRTVRLPAGDATIRFEGVAGGIIPASAIIAGLPGGTVEKNRDARLLSPAALVDGTLGRRVTLRRTDKASGRTSEEDAEIVAGPAEGVVLRTAGGIETLGCSGLKEALRYDRVPADLSARPTLSVLTRSRAGGTATVTLSYLATGFDWSASYVATLGADGRTLDLFAWLTLANANREGFAAAQMQAVAGRLSRQPVMRFAEGAARLELHCYPLGTTTSDLKTGGQDIVVTARRVSKMFDLARPMAMALPAPPPPPPPPPPLPPEDLGDLKLYRVPERVSIAASGQKQVALLARNNVPFERVYRAAIQPGQRITGAPARVILRMRNEETAGLGLALPAGSTALYARRGADPVLLGTGTLDDLAVGERVGLAAGTSRQVLAEQVIDAPGTARVTLTNANPFPVTVEVPIGDATSPTFTSATPLQRIDGLQTWRVTLPANDTASLTYDDGSRR